MERVLSELLSELKVLETRGDTAGAVRGVSYDSRRVREGDLFVAVKGTRMDGHLYIVDAVKKGASAVLVEEMPGSNGMPATLVRVEDTRKALAKLAARFYGHPSGDLKMIGVTGTNGKTTTTLVLESILRQAGASVGVIGTLAYRWGDVCMPAPLTTPESLDLQRLLYEMRRDGVEYVVMEVSSNALAMGRVDGCAFRAGVFTNLSQDHLDFHKTMEDYFAAKTRLFSRHLGSDSERGPAVAAINRDDPYAGRMEDAVAEGNEIWSFSLENADARVRVERMDLSASGIRAMLATPHGDLEIDSPLLGRLNLYNILAAATTALGLGIPMDAVSRGVRAVGSVDGRLQRVSVPAGFDVVVDYAHTPDAMEKSLTCLRELSKGRLIVVFGCGGDRDRGKRPLMGGVAGQLGDLVIVTSDNPRSEDPGAIIRDIEEGVRDAGLPRLPGRKLNCGGKGYAVEPDRRRAIELALWSACPGDLLCIGGKGHETYQIIGNRTFPFDDRVVVRDYFESPKAEVENRLAGSA